MRLHWLDQPMIADSSSTSINFTWRTKKSIIKWMSGHWPQFTVSKYINSYRMYNKCVIHIVCSIHYIIYKEQSIYIHKLYTTHSYIHVSLCFMNHLLEPNAFASSLAGHQSKVLQCMSSQVISSPFFFAASSLDFLHNCFNMTLAHRVCTKVGDEWHPGCCIGLLFCKGCWTLEHHRTPCCLLWRDTFKPNHASQIKPKTSTERKAKHHVAECF